MISSIILYSQDKSYKFFSIPLQSKQYCIGILFTKMKHLTALIYPYKTELLISSIAILGFVLFIPVFTYVYFANDLKSKDAIMNRNNTGIILTDRNNKPFFTFYQAKYTSSVSLSQIPAFVQEAVIASEDKDFYHHSGFSFVSIIRASLYDLLHQDVSYGGSTITQQLVKNALLNSNKNFLRKYQELVLAQEIERRYSKQEILEMYLNSVYLGEGAFGVDNAALTYFGKHAKDLTLAQTSFLAAILPSPSTLSPFTGSILQAKVRQRIVLEKMYEQNYINKYQELQAEKEQLTFNNSNQDINSYAPHFALMVRDELIKKYGEEYISRSGFRVRTTLDLEKQKVAEQAVKKQVTNLALDNVSNGAAVAIDPKTGEILALVGSTNWYDNKFGKMNLATTPRSVGSSFKPIVYSAAFEEHLITPATLLHDVPTVFPGGYAPLDYDRKFRGSVTVRRALSNSLNVPAVEVMTKVGLPNALAMAKRLGVTSLGDPSNYGLSLVLGTGEVPLVELTDAYAVFANNGIHNQPVTILDIYNKYNTKVYYYKPKPQQVLSPAVAFLISLILSDNNARAEEFGNLLTISRPAAVKTGTAEDYKDALTIGYTPSLVVGVWVGNNDNSVMDSVAGSLGAAPIWKDMMENYLANTIVENFSPPSDIVQANVCGNGTVIRDGNRISYGQTEYFIKGTQPINTFCTVAPRIAFPNGVIPSQQPFPNYQNQSPDTQNIGKEIQKRIHEEIKQTEQARKTNAISE